MSLEPFTIVDDGRATAVRASLADGRVRIDAEAMERALGWELTDDGLCRDAMCVPAPRSWSPNGEVALDDLATLLGRPLAIDPDERVAWFGGAAEERARTLRALTAPDFALADLDGRLHRLAEHRGTKVLLVVWASW